MFVHWDHYIAPEAQVLIAPSGVKFGKSYGCALWLARHAWENPGYYCIWIAPTYLKCRIGYRYMKCMLDIPGEAECVDGKLEIRLKNGSFIKFLHGRDAEVTVEGEAVDRFIIDEAGKQKRQLWHSLFTTVTQTMGKGIVTGTPRGFGWYYDEFRKAKLGDPFYTWANFRTSDSPFVKEKALAQAKRLLPKYLYDQYYEALFVSVSTVFGDLTKMFTMSYTIPDRTKFWIHPDPEARALDTFTGWDIAKRRDYSVFYTVNAVGELVGYARFRQVPYEMQVDRLKYYLHNYFRGERFLRYDSTGVGDAVGEMLVDKDIDASITALTFTNKSKQEMINRTIMAIEKGWHKAPHIEQVQHEFGSYEVNVTKSGLFSYSAPDGENDDCVSAGIMAISDAYHNMKVDTTEGDLDKLADELDDDIEENDLIEETAAVFAGDDGFFDDDSDEYSKEIDDFAFPS